MSRTFKRDPYNWYAKEEKEQRKASNRQYRARVRTTMASCSVDRLAETALPRSPHTEGWLTH